MEYYVSGIYRGISKSLIPYQEPVSGFWVCGCSRSPECVIKVSCWVILALFWPGCEALLLGEAPAMAACCWSDPHVSGRCVGSRTVSAFIRRPPQNSASCWHGKGGRECSETRASHELQGREHDVVTIYCRPPIYSLQSQSHLLLTLFAFTSCSMLAQPWIQIARIRDVRKYFQEPGWKIARCFR